MFYSDINLIRASAPGNAGVDAIGDLLSLGWAESSARGRYSFKSPMGFAPRPGDLRYPLLKIGDHRQKIHGCRRVA